MNPHDARTAQSLHWSVVPGHQMSRRLYDEVVTLCTRAYEEDFATLMTTFRGCVHVLGR